MNTEQPLYPSAMASLLIPVQGPDLQKILGKILSFA